MAFILSDLVIESTLREGFANCRNDESIIDDVFAQLKTLPVAAKYGDKEINKIKRLLKKDIPIVNSYYNIESNVPCISIQLLSASELERRAAMDDFLDDQIKPMDEEELAEQVYISGITIDDYDPDSGIVTLDDSTDLTTIHVNNVLEDADGNAFPILAVIANEPTDRRIQIQKQAEINIAGPAEIRSIIDYSQNELRTNVEKETLLIGIHTKEPLLTKYLYVLVKYIIESRKLDLIRRGFQLPTYEGSDFSRNMEYVSDMVYTRYLTIAGEINNTWTSDKVTPIDLIELDIRVERDEATNEQLGREDQTIKVTEEDED